MKTKGIITGASLILFAILTYVVAGSVAAGTSDVLAFDTVIREWFYSLRTPWLTEVVKAITFMGNTKTVVTICVLMLVVPLAVGVVQKFAGKAGKDSVADGKAGPAHNIGFYITKKIGVPIAAVAIIGSAINKVFKHTILRPRPDVSLHLIEQGGWSFPSGHSISGLVLYGFLVWLIRRYALGSSAIQFSPDTLPHEVSNSCKLFVNIATVVLTLLWIGIGLSRIYLGVHYPTDILGGWTLGMVVMMAAIMVIEKMEKRKQ